MRVGVHISLLARCTSAQFSSLTLLLGEAFSHHPVPPDDTTGPFGPPIFLFVAYRGQRRSRLLWPKTKASFMADLSTWYIGVGASFSPGNVEFPGHKLVGSFPFSHMVEGHLDGTEILFLRRPFLTALYSAWPVHRFGKQLHFSPSFFSRAS